MEQIFIRILNMSISAGWLILAILLLRPLMKKAPKQFSCAMWALAGLRLVLPFSFESILSLLPSGETIPAEILYSPSPFIRSGIPALNSAVNPIISESFAPVPAASANPLQIISFVAACIWLAGVAAMLGYALFSTLRLKHRLRTATFLQQNILQSEYVSSPFVFGLFRPRIYLPYHIDSEDTAYVIAHESAHIRRLDHITKPIGFLILSLHWFNPLAWLAYSLFSKDIEFSCDERVIADYTASERQAYSSALLNCSIGRRHIAAQPLAFGETSIKKRIKSVMSHKRTPIWITVICIIICAVLALCFLTDPVSTVPLLPIEGEYGVENVVYENGSFSYVMTPENYPLFSVSADMELMQSSSSSLGIMQEIVLTKENFDHSFHNREIWHDKSISPAKLRRNNAKAWTVLNGEHFYTLLQQKNGELYLVQGGVTLNSGPLARWVFRLASLSTSLIGGADGPTSIVIKPQSSVRIIGGADGPTSIFVSQTAEEITYRYHSTEEPILPTVTLYPDDMNFGFCYSGFSSYYPYGIYEISGNQLILQTDDGRNTYVFHMEKDALIFDQMQSSEIPSYANIPDGAVFRKE